MTRRDLLTGGAFAAAAAGTAAAGTPTAPNMFGVATSSADLAFMLNLLDGFVALDPGKVTGVGSLTGYLQTDGTTRIFAQFDLTFPAATGSQIGAALNEHKQGAASSAGVK